MINKYTQKVDVCVVGAGHAGCEAFLLSVWTVLL